MATTYKVLGQSAPANTNNADVYTCPSATQAIISTIVVANTSSAVATCKIYVRIDAAAAAASNAIIFNGAVYPGDLKTLTLGITIDASDVITVSTDTANALTFHVFGAEIA